MVSERPLRVFHPVLFGLIGITSLITLIISASLVSHYNDIGYPSTTARDRIKIILVAAIWSTIFSAYLLIGVIIASSHILFGVASHLFTLTIAFLLFLIGSSSLTALTVHYDCTNDGFSRCNIVKGLVAVSWIDTIFIFVALLGILGIGMRRRKDVGGIGRASLVSSV